MYVILPIFLPEIILASRTCGAILVMISLVPLQSPSDWSMFLMSIIGVPTLSLILWFGSPEVYSELKNAGVMISNDSHSALISDLSIESELKYWFSSPIISNCV